MSSNHTHADVLVIGGGAAGLFCALTAGKRGKSVTVLEHSPAVGNKIRISGGGRCNFTNLNVSAENYLSENPHFCKSALAIFTPEDFLAMMGPYSIEYYEKQDGLFCTDSSRHIISMLLEECVSSGVRIHTGCQVDGIERDGSFMTRTKLDVFSSDALVIATGGLSLPEIGASDFGLKTALQFGLRVVPPRAALVPFVLDQDWKPFVAELSGASVDAVVKCAAAEFRGSVLFTHRGLSGPAILQSSLYWKSGEPLELNLLPDAEPEELVLLAQASSLEVHTFLGTFLPRRFVLLWCQRHGLSGPLARSSAKALLGMINQLQHWVLLPRKTEGYRTAEVMAGGVDTRDLSSRTMEAKGIPGLYFIGEVVDVTGWLGGYNFQWAWASGFAAGQAV